MLIPISSDAPLYHWPVMTVVIAVFTCAFSALMWQVEEELFLSLILRFGEGLHPQQWFTAACMHANLVHLVGNMVFLLPFGFLIEGKIGWWRFALLYFGIGAAENALVQLMMLNSQQLGALGASGALFGLVAVAVLWAPKNEMTCLVVFSSWFRFVYARTFDLPISVLAGFYLCWEVGMFLLDSFTLDSAALHLIGATLGGIAGLLFLKFKWVDCEGWDLISVLSGNDASSIRTRELILDNPLENLKKQEEAQSQRHEKHRALAQQQIHDLLTQNNFAVAQALFKKSTETLGELPLSAAHYLRLGKGMLDAGRHEEAIDHWLSYLKLESKPAEKVRLKLAELLIDHARRPATAIEVLQPLAEANLPADLSRIHRKLIQKATSQLDVADLELE